MSDNPPGLDDVRAIVVPAIERYLAGVTRWACLGGKPDEIARRFDLGNHALESLLTSILSDLRKWGEGQKANELMMRLEAWLAARRRNLDLFLDGTLHEPEESKRRHTANRIAAELDLTVEETELLASIIEGGYQATFHSGELPTAADTLDDPDA